MKTYPLQSITIDEAKEKQFRLVDIITKHLRGDEFLNLGDLGVSKQYNKPVRTKTVENILAEFFNAEACMLTRGAGTQALKWGLLSSIKPTEKILVHKAPIYPTTKTNVEAMGLNVVEVDFNNLTELEKVISKNEDIKLCLIQHTRQKIEDKYDLEEVIATIKKINKNIHTLVDDNYAVMKVAKIGNELGASLSAFSMFKLLGPEGIGCLVGKKDLVEFVSKQNYSGGGQVQGYEAMEVLRGLVYAPVSLAIQAEENEKLLTILSDKTRFPYVKNSFLANAQSKILLIEFNDNIANKILGQAMKLGALPNPVGAESKYEIPPLFYRVSGTFLKADPTLADRMIRINPNRSGAATIIRILEESYKNM